MPSARENLNRPHRLGDPVPRRVVILRALQLGDLLCAVPAFRSLRTALPDAEIVLIGLPWAKVFVERFAHYLSGFHEFPGYPGLPERRPRLDQVPAFLAAMQGERFDLVIQMHGSGKITNPLAALLGARVQAGFFCPGDYCPDGERFLPYPAQVPEVWRQLRLMEFLGIPLQDEDLEFPVGADDQRRLHALPGVDALRPGAYVCVHPGARAAERRWPPEQFTRVADALAARGLRVVLTGSPEEAPLTQALAGAMKTAPLDLAGQTDLGTLAALLQGARLLVCNDTGVSHLAAALRVPSVVILHRLAGLDGWAPLDRQRHRVVCGVAGVSPAAVIAQAEDLLRTDALPDNLSPPRKENRPPCVPCVS